MTRFHIGHVLLILIISFRSISNCLRLIYLHVKLTESTHLHNWPIFVSVWLECVSILYLNPNQTNCAYADQIMASTIHNVHNLILNSSYIPFMYEFQYSTDEYIQKYISRKSNSRLSHFNRIGAHFVEYFYSLAKFKCFFSANQRLNYSERCFEL